MTYKEYCYEALATGAIVMYKKIFKKNHVMVIDTLVISSCV